MPKPGKVPGLDERTPMVTAARKLLAGRLRDVRGHERGALAAGHDPVHDMRVACRRLRAALQLFGGERLRPLEAEVKELQDALGAVRDLHVQEKWLRATGLRRLIAEREGRLGGATAALRRALGRFARDTAPALEAALPEVAGKGHLGGSALRSELGARLRKLQRRMKRARALEPGPAHELRIAAKRLRYEAELLEAGAPRAAEELLAQVEPLQDALGELHDADVRLDLLRAFLESAREGEVPRGLSALVQLYAEREALAEAAGREVRRWRHDHVARGVHEQLQLTARR
jgi:CHAD domain-containing protein